MTATARIAFALLVERDVRRVPGRPGAQDHAAPTSRTCARRSSSHPTATAASTACGSAFFLKRTDDVTATVLNRAGDEIRVLAEGGGLRAGRAHARSSGTAPDARRPPGGGRHPPHPPEPAPSGPRGADAAQHRQGHEAADVRSRRSARADTVRRRQLLPHDDGEPAECRSRRPAGARRSSSIAPTCAAAPGPRRSRSSSPTAPRPGSGAGRSAGRRVAAGSYPSSSAPATGPATSAPRRRSRRASLRPPAARPRRHHGPLPARPGTAAPVRRAGRAASPSTSSASASRGGAPRRRPASASAAAAPARASCASRAPGGKSGLYLFDVGRDRPPRRRSSCQAREAHGARRAAGDDLAGAQPRRRPRRRRPTRSTPACRCGSRPVRQATASRRDSPPRGALLAQLDRKGRRYDLTTDVALARGAGPSSAGTAA